MTGRIGFVGSDSVCAELRALLPFGQTLECLTTDAAAARIAEGALGLLIVAVDAPEWRDSVERMAVLQAAGDVRPVAVLALVPRSDPAALVRAFEMGAADVAQLPLDPHEVRARLAALLRRRKVAIAKQAEVMAVLRLAVIDPVTGLYNRHHLDTTLPAAIDSARAGNRPLALLMLDLDALKPFNDKWGHAAGDRVLRAVARTLQAQMRTTDTVARYGGDEIVVVMPDTDADTARAVADRLVAAVAETRIGRAGDGAVGVTVSVGVAVLTARDRDARELLGRADAAVYAAKRGGRNQVAEAA